MGGLPPITPGRGLLCSARMGGGATSHCARGDFLGPDRAGEGLPPITHGGSCYAWPVQGEALPPIAHEETFHSTRAGEGLPPIGTRRCSMLGPCGGRGYLPSRTRRLSTQLVRGRCYLPSARGDFPLNSCRGGVTSHRHEEMLHARPMRGEALPPIAHEETFPSTRAGEGLPPIGTRRCSSDPPTARRARLARHVALKSSEPLVVQGEGHDACGAKGLRATCSAQGEVGEARGAREAGIRLCMSGRPATVVVPCRGLLVTRPFAQFPTDGANCRSNEARQYT